MGRCGDCWWLSDRFTCVCVNEQSSHCADFVRLDDTCPYFDVDTERLGKVDVIPDWVRRKDGQKVSTDTENDGGR